MSWIFRFAVLVLCVGCSSETSAPGTPVSTPGMSFSLSIVGEGAIFDAGPAVVKLCDSGSKPCTNAGQPVVTEKGVGEGYYLQESPAKGWRFSQWSGTCTDFLVAGTLATTPIINVKPPTAQTITCTATFVPAGSP